MQNYTDIANGNVPLTVENACMFSFFEFKLRTDSFAKENNWSIVFFIKMLLFYDDRIEITCKNQSIFQVIVMLKITFKQF